MAIVLAPVTRAAAPSAVGWWLQRDENVPDEVMPPPDVPSGGLYVSANVTGAQAVGAVRYAVEDGATPESLTLAIASTSGTVVIDACPPAGPWQPAQRGAWDARPEPDCGDDGSRRVSGTVAPDASTVTFALSGAHLTDGLDLVLMPGIDPATSTTAVFDVAFEAPGAGSLAVSAPSGSPAEEASTTVATTVAAAENPSPAPAAASSARADTGQAAAQELSPPSTAGAPTPSASGSAFDAGASSFSATNDGPLEMSGGRRAAAIAIFVMMLALLAWVNRDALLARAGAGATAPVQVLPSAPSERVVGVGRFARPRKGPTPPL